MSIFLLLAITFSIISVVNALATVPNPGHDISGLGGYGATGDLFYGTNGTSGGVSALADVAAGSYLRSGGVGAAPLWSTITLPNAVTTGDLLYGSASNVVSALNDVATGNALISGGAGVAPSYGKIALTTHISGILPTANGGTGIAYFTAAGPTTARVYTFPDANKTIAANDASNLTLTSQAAGDLLVASGGTSYGRLAKGTANQVLAMDGTGTNLLWTTAAGGGDMTLAGIQTVTGAKTFDPGKLILAAGTTALAPLTLTEGTNLTTAANGSIEMDANAFYGTTDAGNRGYIPIQHCIRADATRTFTSNTTQQAIFNSPANGRLTLETGTYKFQGSIAMTAMSGTTGNGKFSLIGAGNATLGAILWQAFGLDNTAETTGAAAGGSWHVIATQTGVNIVTTATQTALAFFANGTFEVTGAGTIIPSFAQTTAAAAVVSIGSYLCFERIGSITTTSIGQWD